PRQFLKDDRNEDENTNEQLTNVESTPEAAPQPNLASPNDASSDAEENNTSDKAGDPEEAVSALPSPAGYKDGMKVFIDGQIRPTQQPKFVYPEMSRLIREEGEVQMEAVVGSDGRVEVIRLLKSSGSPRLDDYSLKQAAEQLKFSPTGEKFLFRFGPKYKLKDGPPEFLRSREADKLKKSN
ncbi:MAG: TonB family protein, partial [Bdellovibrionales bacterium]|nr:TonB family protein [Bdellovibrionales bacterium]